MRCQKEKEKVAQNFVLRLDRFEAQTHALALRTGQVEPLVGVLPDELDERVQHRSGHQGRGHAERDRADLLRAAGHGLERCVDVVPIHLAAPFHVFNLEHGVERLGGSGLQACQVQLVGLVGHWVSPCGFCPHWSPCMGK
jgi:hypothetical protein